jgi:hypothetical protein
VLLLQHLLLLLKLLLQLLELVGIHALRSSVVFMLQLLLLLLPASCCWVVTWEAWVRHLLLLLQLL